MRRTRAAVVTTVSTVVLGAGWAAGLVTAANNAPVTLDAAPTTDQATTSASASASASTSASASASASATATATETSAAAETPAAVSGTFDGTSVSTKFGVYQAEIVVTDGVITSVTAIQDGDGDRETDQINARAIPTLVERILTAQSWNVQGVSGASYTSPALLTSVKDAMTQAGLA